MKINNFRGELTDGSAEKEPLTGWYEPLTLISDQSCVLIHVTDTYAPVANSVRPVISFSKINRMFLRYFDRININL